MKYSKQGGFTLIELIVVLVILGILAATALPRFADLSVDARVAAASGVEGGIRSASAIAHAQALVDGQTSGAGVVTLEGTAITLIHGYPTGLGIIRAAQVAGSSVAITASSAATTTWQIDGLGTCNVVYTAPTITGTAPVITPAGTCN